MTLHVIKDSVEKMSIPYELDAMGFPHFNGKYLVSRKVCESAGVDPKPLICKRPTEATRKYYLRMGVNPDGNRLVDHEQLEGEKSVERRDREAARRAALTDEQRSKEDRIREGQKAWEEVDRLYYLSNKALIRDTDEMNVDRGNRLKARASSLASRILSENPEFANWNKAQRLREQAAHQRELAVGALTYDADGWISREGRQKRHDEMLQKAQALEQEAAKLE